MYTLCQRQYGDYRLDVAHEGNRLASGDVSRQVILYYSGGLVITKGNVIFNDDEVNVHKIGEVIAALLRNVEGVDDLRNMVSDIQHKADMLDWSECPSCGRLSFYLPEAGPQPCCWCGQLRV